MANVASRANKWKEPGCVCVCVFVSVCVGEGGGGGLGEEIDGEGKENVGEG